MQEWRVQATDSPSRVIPAGCARHHHICPHPHPHHHPHPHPPRPHPVDTFDPHHPHHPHHPHPAAHPHHRAQKSTPFDIYLRESNTRLRADEPDPIVLREPRGQPQVSAPAADLSAKLPALPAVATTERTNTTVVTLYRIKPGQTGARLIDVVA